MLLHTSSEVTVNYKTWTSWSLQAAEEILTALPTKWFSQQRECISFSELITASAKIILLWKGDQFGNRIRPLYFNRSNTFYLWTGPSGWPALTEGSSPKSVMCYSSNTWVYKTIIVTVLLHILQQMAIIFVVNYNNMFLCFYEQIIKKNLAAATETPWVLHFDKGPMDNLEMRKLPAFTSDVNVSCLLADFKTYLGKV